MQGVSEHERIKWSPIVKVVDWPAPAFGRRHVKAFGRRLCGFSSSERVLWRLGGNGVPGEDTASMCRKQSENTEKNK